MKLIHATLCLNNNAEKPLKNSLNILFSDEPINLFKPPLVKAEFSVIKKTFALSIGHIIMLSMRAIENPVSSFAYFRLSIPKIALE